MQENNEIKHLKLEDIIPNRLQPRTEFDEEKLNELANSIKQYGVINPIIVRPVGNKYEIIAGERRYKASKIAGLTQVPVIISNMDDSTSAEVAIIENIQRQDLTALEEAKSYRKLLDQGNITQEQLAQKMGKTQSTIANKMRLLHLCDEVQEALENNQISERHARSLLQLKDINDQRNMLERIIKERMTVKATENAIKEIIHPKTLNTNNEIINNDIITSQSLNENIYGNDVVNIMDLNKKELEKENDNMNNNDFNMNMAPGVMPTSPMEQSVAPTTGAAPAFGERFFPSLEDQETNINLNNPFEMPVPTPAPQPMMENLVDPAPIVPPTPAPEPTPTPIMQPVASVAPEQNINIPTFVTGNQSIPSIAPTIENNTESTEINLPPMPDMQPSVPEPIVGPMPQNDFIPNIPTLETPVMEPSLPNNNIIAEPIINPIAENIPEMPAPMPSPEVAPEPVMPPVQPEPFVAPIMEQPMEIPQPEMPSAPVEVPPVMPTFEVPAMEQPIEAPIAPTAEEIPTLDNKPTDNIINAINALKNLGLSIQSIGYKATISEEDTPNTYKITIELEK